MIYNMDDEKRKLRHQDRNDFSGYLSEEALAELIGQVEDRKMLRAPAHLKSNVMAQVGRERRSAGKRQIITYQAKVFIAMAAALTVLILMPAGSAEDAGQHFMTKQTSAVSIEQAALERQKNIDDNWERYRQERASGGIRGLIDDIGHRVSQLGENLSWDRSVTDRDENRK